MDIQLGVWNWIFDLEPGVYDPRIPEWDICDKKCASKV